MPGMLVTKRAALNDAYPDLGQRFPELDISKYLDEHGIKADDAEFIQKGLVASDMKFEDGERAVIATITTTTKDRDNEIVDPAGAVLTEYNKNKVVLFGHDHRSLPIGKNLWIKLSPDKKSLIAKTEYTNETQNPIGNQIYEYRKGGFPLAYSIGFIPLQWETYKEGDGTPESKAGVRRKFTKWILLEYSDVPIPSNPEAVAIAVSKSLIKIDETEEYGCEKDAVLTIIDEKKVAGEREDADEYECKCVDCGWETTSKEHCKDIKCKECGGEMRRKERPGDGKELDSDEEKAAFEERLAALEKEIAEKRADTKGNPSVWDIMESIQSILTPKQGDSWSKWVSDIYPTKYPSGHVVIEVNTKEARKYLQHDYEYDDGAVTLSKDSVELESGYKPKKGFEDIMTKAGRVISDKNRSIITKATSAMGEATEALTTLIDATAEKPKTSAAEDALEPEDNGDEEKSAIVLNIIETVIDDNETKTINIDTAEIEKLVTARVESMKLSKEDEATKIKEIVRTTIDKIRGKV